MSAKILVVNDQPSSGVASELRQQGDEGEGEHGADVYARLTSMPGASESWRRMVTVVRDDWYGAGEGGSTLPRRSLR